MKNLALRLAGISLSLGAFCFALVSISIPMEDASQLQIPSIMRGFLGGVGLFSLVAAALMIDWTIDSFLPADWDELDEVNADMGEKKFSRDQNYVFARARLFGGGYLLLALATSGLIFLMTWVVTIHLTGQKSGLLPLSYGIAALTSVAVFIKLMTRRLLPASWTLVVLVIVAVISVAINIALLSGS